MFSCILLFELVLFLPSVFPLYCLLNPSVLGDFGWTQFEGQSKLLSITLSQVTPCLLESSLPVSKLSFCLFHSLDQSTPAAPDASCAIFFFLFWFPELPADFPLPGERMARSYLSVYVCMYVKFIDSN